MTQELREKVANTIRWKSMTSEEIADAAIAIIRALVLEEAAKVVRRMPSPSSDWMADELLRALGGPTNPVPAAIRALTQEGRDEQPRRTLDEMRGMFEEAYKQNRTQRDD